MSFKVKAFSDAVIGNYRFILRTKINTFLKNYTFKNLTLLKIIIILMCVFVCMKTEIFLKARQKSVRDKSVQKTKKRVCYQTRQNKLETKK